MKKLLGTGAVLTALMTNLLFAVADVTPTNNFVLKNGNVANVSKKTCADGNEGYSFEITNPRIPKTKVVYDSCEKSLKGPVVLKGGKTLSEYISSNNSNSSVTRTAATVADFFANVDNDTYYNDKIFDLSSCSVSQISYTKMYCNQNSTVNTIDKLTDEKLSSIKSLSSFSYKNYDKTSNISFDKLTNLKKINSLDFDKNHFFTEKEISILNRVTAVEDFKLDSNSKFAKKLDANSYICKNFSSIYRISAKKSDVCN